MNANTEYRLAFIPLEYKIAVVLTFALFTASSQNVRFLCDAALNRPQFKVFNSDRSCQM